MILTVNKIRSGDANENSDAKKNHILGKMVHRDLASYLLNINCKWINDLQINKRVITRKITRGNWVLRVK